MTETPTTPVEPPAPGSSWAQPAPAPTRKRPRGFETVGDMVRSLSLVLVVVVVVFLLTLRDEPASKVTAIDYGAQLAQTRAQAAYDVFAPVGLGRAWRATSARGSTDGSAVTWHLGVVTPSDDYAAVEQSDGARPAFLDEFAEGGERSGPVTIGGATWTRIAGGEPNPRALLRASGGASTLVAGTASWAELRRLAGALRAD